MDRTAVHLTTLYHVTPRGGNNTSFLCPSLTPPRRLGSFVGGLRKSSPFLGRFFVILFELLEIYTTFALGK